MSPARRALIVSDGKAPHVHAAVRALRATGWEVGLAVGGAPSDRASDAVAVPLPEAGADAFVEAVASVVAARGYDVVFGADDIELLALSSGRERIPCVVPHGAHADVVRAVDKLELARAAIRAGLRTPDTRPVSPAALAALTGPVVVKARLHWEPGPSQARRHAAGAYCATPAEAARHAQAMAAAGARPLLQEPIDGELMALTMVVDRDGLPVAVAQQRSPRLSLRQTSCRAHTVDAEPELAAAAGRLLADLRWFGLANLQFLRPADGAPRLIDLNGRFYGSLALAVAAGVNVPDLWARMAVGDPVPSFTSARPGVRFQALGEDLRRARAQPRGGLLRDVAGTLAYGVGAAHPHLSLSDPRPALAVLGRLAVNRAGR